ncbi:AbiJ-NTD4 domain-containing protein [Acinetobacter ihumii]|uniref:AbiJ-NTD4 domain-containing protein n=1 Tax=Acinetobacter ihumii TaxID=2483802 RepID=UPI0010319317|nr:hypothetical protein [Acinetobacter ihumii]
MRFSERSGYKAVREIIQKESIDQELRNALWSLYDRIIFANFQNYDPYAFSTSYILGSNLEGFFLNIYMNVFQRPTDEIPQFISDGILSIKKYFMSCEWYEVYDFIEVTLENYPNIQSNSDIFSKSINLCLEKYLSAYRLSNGNILEITSEQEIQSIEDALENTNQHSGVQLHLNQALKLISDRQNPDYRNSIKESISAVESICKVITQDDKATLGKALKIIEDRHDIHPALKNSLNQLYGYTSDGDGIRHAMLDESNLSYIDAKFMLVSCTNFINYLIKKTK